MHFAEVSTEIALKNSALGETTRTSWRHVYLAVGGVCEGRPDPRL